MTTKPYYPVRIAGRSRKTRFSGSRNTVYKKLHERGYSYDRHQGLWMSGEPVSMPKPKKHAKKPKSRESNKKLIVAVGDYKGVAFDILIQQIMDSQEYGQYISLEGLRDEILDRAASLLRDRGQFGLAAMLDKSTTVRGLEVTDTQEDVSAPEFVRFKIRGEERLDEIKTKREVPDMYKKYKQAKL